MGNGKMGYVLSIHSNICVPANMASFIPLDLGFVQNQQMLTWQPCLLLHRNLHKPFFKLHISFYINTHKISDFQSQKKSYFLRTHMRKMVAKSIFCSKSFTSSLLSPAVRPSYLNNRKLLLIPLAVDPGKWNLCVNQKTFRFCTKATVRGNMEAVGVPNSVPVRVAHELLLAGHRYLDVRTPEEFIAGHAVGAINIPYMCRVGSGMTKNPKFLEQVSSHFGKYDEIIVGCQLGKRSMMAATDLLAAGYTAVTDIAGGYDAWTQNGLPTEN